MKPLPRHSLAPLSPVLVLLLNALLSADSPAQSVRAVLADGFDFPVGKPHGAGFYLARGYRPNGHLGEDWNGRGGGNSDLGVPVYAVAHGVVVYSANYRQGWGNVVIIRHAYRERDGRVRWADSLYGHLDRRMAALGEPVRRGQQIGTIGTNDGMYWAHLHFEMRKNLDIGLNRSRYACDDRNYLCPTTFIQSHRSLAPESRLVAMPGLPSAGPVPGLASGSKVDREMGRFLAQHQIQRRPENAPEGPEVTTTLATLHEERPGAAEERTRIREFWQRLRGA